MNRVIGIGVTLLFLVFPLNFRVKANIGPSADPVQNWCSEVNGEIARFKWKLNVCDGIFWKVGGHSVQGRPLVYAEFGDLHAKNTTLVFSMVHGDEITPLYLGIQLAHLLKQRQGEMVNTRVVVAPLVNPDGFLRHPRTRVNAHGVDINRNFATADWGLRAKKLWTVQLRKDPRRFPGIEPSSEPETIFQQDMINLVKPQKILSIHSPLNFLDYDGPGTIEMPQFPNQYVQECLKLRKRLKAISGGFYPGSLGNYAGHLGIPTLTAELRSTDANKADLYWRQVKQWVQTLIQFNVPDFASRGSHSQTGG